MNDKLQMTKLSNSLLPDIVIFSFIIFHSIDIQPLTFSIPPCVPAYHF